MSEATAPPPQSEPPSSLTEPTPEFAEHFSRIAIRNLLVAANEPGRAAEHNRQASRLVTMPGVRGMQQIPELHVVMAMLAQLCHAQAALLNLLLVANGCTPELKPMPTPENGGKPPQKAA